MFNIECVNKSPTHERTGLNAGRRPNATWLPYFQPLQRGVRATRYWLETLYLGGRERDCPTLRACASRERILSMPTTPITRVQFLRCVRRVLLGTSVEGDRAYDYHTNIAIIARGPS